MVGNKFEEWLAREIEDANGLIKRYRSSELISTVDYWTKYLNFLIKVQREYRKLREELKNI